MSVIPDATEADEERVREALMQESARQNPPPIIGVERISGAPGVPELLFDLNYDACYWGCPPILDPAEPFLIRSQNHPAFQRAGHRRDGIFATVGKGVARGVDEKPIAARDVAPTLMYLAGGAVPERVDGRVHVAAVDERRLRDRPPTTRAMPVEREVIATPYGDEALRSVERRLRDLGYMG